MNSADWAFIGFMFALIAAIAGLDVLQNRLVRKKRRKSRRRA